MMDCNLQTIINWSLLAILIIGIILIAFFTYHKHKGEKGLGKKLIIRHLVFLLIMFIAWFIISALFWFTNCVIPTDEVIILRGGYNNIDNL